MPRKKSVNKDTVETVANTTFEVLPLLRKKLLRMDVVQAEHNMPMSQVQMLAMLGENGALSVSEISKRLGIAKPNNLLMGPTAVDVEDPEATKTTAASSTWCCCPRGRKSSPPFAKPSSAR